MTAISEEMRPTQSVMERGRAGPLGQEVMDPGLSWQWVASPHTTGVKQGKARLPLLEGLCIHQGAVREGFDPGSLYTSKMDFSRCCQILVSAG